MYKISVSSFSVLSLGNSARLAGAALLVMHARAETISLGDATGFAVLAGSGITNTGATFIKGDIGTYPTPAITGYSGTIITDQVLLQSAKEDLLTAYNSIAGLTPMVTLVDSYDLGASSPARGIYHTPSDLFITGDLTLDAGGDPNASWIFQIGSTLTTASGSRVVLVNGAQAANVFWQVGGAATLGAGSVFAGNILALTSITLTTGVKVDGRAMALNGAVTMDMVDIQFTEQIVSEPPPP